MDQGLADQGQRAVKALNAQMKQMRDDIERAIAQVNSSIASLPKVDMRELQTQVLSDWQGWQIQLQIAAARLEQERLLVQKSDAIGVSVSDLRAEMRRRFGSE